MYVKRGNYNTLDEYVMQKTGKTPDKLNEYGNYVIRGLDSASEILIRTINAGRPVVVFSDFDVDGQTSAAQWIMLLSYLRANFWVYAPMRSVDGYGIKKSFVEKLKDSPKGLLVTVDNGIAAAEEIMLARHYGWQVLVMDHHEAPVDKNGVIQLPQADIIIDPYAVPGGCTFKHYCGAGLTYKLAQTIVKDPNYLDTMLTIAAIGTIADVVTMHEDNRQIVQRGLALINSGRTTTGINKMVERLQMNGFLTSTDVAFSIVPMLNAASRLETEEAPGFSGSDFAISTLLCSDELDGVQRVLKLTEMNKRRKELTKETLDNLSVATLDPVAFIKANSPKGILGILAAKIAEQTGKPAFVFSEHNGICAGSARAGNTDTDVKAMLDSVQDLLISGGGHAPAAGFAFKAENLEKIKEGLNLYPDIKSVKQEEYDLEITPDELMPMLIRLDSMEPFGKDFEKPIFKVRCNCQKKEFWHTIGGGTLKLDLPEMTGICFGASEEFIKNKTPRQFTIYGTPDWNNFNGKRNPQFKINKIEY